MQDSDHVLVTTSNLLMREFFNSLTYINDSTTNTFVTKRLLLELVSNVMNKDADIYYNEFKVPAITFDTLTNIVANLISRQVIEYPFKWDNNYQINFEHKVMSSSRFGNRCFYLCKSRSNIYASVLELRKQKQATATGDTFRISKADPNVMKACSHINPTNMSIMLSDFCSCGCGNKFSTCENLFLGIQCYKDSNVNGGVDIKLKRNSFNSLLEEQKMGNNFTVLAIYSINNAMKLNENLSSFDEPMRVPELFKALTNDNDRSLNCDNIEKTILRINPVVFIYIVE